MKRTLLLICTLLCANVLLAGFWEGDLRYWSETGEREGEATVYGCKDSVTSVNIPSTVTHAWADYYDYECHCYLPNIKTYSVTRIGWPAFSDCSSLTSVNIPNSVTYIQSCAFQNCSSLTSVNIPNSVTYIGSGTFSGCSSLASVTIPNSVTYIGYSAFKNCSSLISVTIPNSITYIESWTFKNCSSLTSVTIPNSVTTIGDFAFYDCSSLTSITIPNSVTSIGLATFYGCSSLSSVNIPNSVTYIGDYAFRGCSILTSITIPNSVTFIGYAAFASCISLTSVDIPNSVTSIGGLAFHYCTGLESINLSDNITSIGRNCFDSCINLTTVNIPTSLSVIDTSLFRYCTSLTSVTIPNSVTSIGYAAFIGCSSLTSITIPNSVTSIDYWAFWLCSSLTSVTLGNSVSSIGDYAFASCSSLTSVTIPNSVTYIGYAAFGECSSLTSVTLGNSVTSIQDMAFAYCSSLTSVTCLANTPPYLGDDVFYNTPSNKILNVNCGLKDDYISSWTDFYSYNIHEIPIVVNATANDEAFGSVAVEGDCSSLTLTATANNCYQFVSWNDGNTENPRIVNLTSDTSFIATFEEINFNTELSATICQGQVYTENGFNVSEAGVYTQTLTSVNGCDSIITLSLNVNPTFNTELSANICQGQVYNENGFNVSEAGVYTQTLTSVNGCDSIVTLTLNVNPIYNTELSATICEGQVYTENNFNVSETGVYTQTLTSINGCDSIVTLTVSVNPTFDTTINATINAGETYAEFGFNESEAGTYVQNLQTEFGCDSTITLVLSVNSSLLEAEIEEISFYPNPTDSKVNFSQAIEKVEVIDLTGKTIFTFTNAKTINIESLPSGAYYLRLTNDEKTIMQKVIKQ